MGKRVSFEIAKDSVEGPTHRTECPKEDEVHTYPDTEDGPLAQLEDKAIKDKAESTRVEKCKVDKVRVGNDRVDLTKTPKAKGQGHPESTKTIDPKYGEGNQTSPKSYTRNDASHQTPDDGSNDTNHLTEMIAKSEPKSMTPRRSRQA